MQTVSPEQVGLCSTRLGRVDAWLNAQIDAQRLAGASVLIGRRGGIAHVATAGVMDLDSRAPFARDTVVRIYSMTKPITTVAAMMLYERGCFQLDHPVADYLPEFAQTRVWAGGAAPIEETVPMHGPLTVRQLMTHTSGLTYGFMRTNVVDAAYRAAKIDDHDAHASLAQQVERIAQIPLLCQPGSQWNYSVSTDVLGRLVEVWSGQLLGEFVEQSICRPLGMVDTGFHVRDGQAQRFAALYSPLSGADLATINQPDPAAVKRKGLKLQERSEGSRYLSPTHLHSGGGGMVGTLDDYAQFCQMLLNRGELDGVRLLGRKTVEYMRTNQLPDNGDMAAMGQPVWSETSYEGIGFGLGFAVVLDPVRASIVASVGEHHWGGAASTFFWLDPQEDLYVVFLTQLMPSSTYPIRRELRAAVNQALID